MSLVIKHIGKNDYQYDVSWDRKSKKQIWKYIGKVNTNAKKPLLHDIGKLFTNKEKDTIERMLLWIAGRAIGQAGCGHRKAVALLRERFHFDLYTETTRVWHEAVKKPRARSVRTFKPTKN